ncbi:site-specific integrase [Megasphaera stantonii]|uniref:site-specific integrase n=1 Tax=Megasphaera stantonii TaxID=2144175 RepID=UPI001DA382CF|nr:site-specific integrase [Megasphaera stantonii]HJE82886.1 site-specific integrase [Megasphaera stantonii]
MTTTFITTKRTDLFHQYYSNWLIIYKEGSIRDVTMKKYRLTESWLKKLAPDLRIVDLDRIAYQKLINDYAENHERQTTMDFHHQLKGAIIDALDEGLIDRDPTRKVIIKGKPPSQKKAKYLSRYELQKLLAQLKLTEQLTMDWLILLVAKTGLRFSEALAVTPKDFDFLHQTLSIDKTWNYKGEGGFLPTKNRSSIRKIKLDWQTVIQFFTLIKNLPPQKPIFVPSKKKIYNSTVNDILERYCIKADIPIISMHGLRHTHASLLLFADVSVASVARRLGHSSINTTQRTYLHIIRELESKDIDLIMRSLSSLLS